MQKVLKELITASRVKVSPPPLSVPTTQPAFVGPCHLPKILVNELQDYKSFPAGLKFTADVSMVGLPFKDRFYGTSFNRRTGTSDMKNSHNFSDIEPLHVSW